MMPTPPSPGHLSTTQHLFFLSALRKISHTKAAYITSARSLLVCCCPSSTGGRYRSSPPPPPLRRSRLFLDFIATVALPADSQKRYGHDPVSDVYKSCVGSAMPLPEGGEIRALQRAKVRRSTGVMRYNCCAAQSIDRTIPSPKHSGRGGL